MPKKSVQHQNTCGFIILQKLCKILEKKFLANLDNFCPRRTWCTQFPIFVRYSRKLMANNKTTSRNLGKMGPISRRNLPGKNWSFLQKWQKIVFNIKIRAVSLFCKNCAKFSKKSFWQIWTIFNLGGPVVHNSPFLCVTPRKLMANNKKTSRNLWKMGLISWRNLPGKNWLFLQKWQKIVFTIKIRAVSLFCKNCAKFSKKVFWQIWSIFDLGGHVVYNSPFLLITPVNWW